jgi:hypothetical protein
MKVAGGGADVGVTEQDLDGAQIGPGIEHVSGAGVSEQMRVDGEWNRRAAARLKAKYADGLVLKGLGRAHGGREKPVGGVAQRQ